MNASEERGEVVNDLVDKARKLVNRFNKRLRLDDLRLVERYLKSEVELRIAFNCGDLAPGRHYVAHLERAPSWRGFEGGSILHHEAVSFAGWRSRKGYGSELCADGDQVA